MRARSGRSVLRRRLSEAAGGEGEPGSPFYLSIYLSVCLSLSLSTHTHTHTHTPLKRAPLPGRTRFAWHKLRHPPWAGSAGFRKTPRERALPLAGEADGEAVISAVSEALDGGGTEGGAAPAIGRVRLGAVGSFLKRLPSTQLILYIYIYIYIYI